MSDFAAAIVAASVVSVLMWLKLGRSARVTETRARTTPDAAPDLQGVLDALQGGTKYHSVLLLSLHDLLSNAEMSSVELRAHAAANFLQKQRLRSCAELIPENSESVPLNFPEALRAHGMNVGNMGTSLKSAADSNGHYQVDPLLRSAAQLQETNEVLSQQLEEAQRQLTSQSEQLKSAESAARTDALTKLPNRRAFEERLGGLLSRASAEGEVFALLLLDLDRFKQVNDTHGHAAGDAVLSVAAMAFRESCRGSDFPARYGGEEFVLLCPNTSAQSAVLLAERIRQRIAMAIVVHEQQQVRVTVSIGIAESKPGDIRGDLVERADSALYAAKHGGRNRSCLYGGDDSSEPARSWEPEPVYR